MTDFIAEMNQTLYEATPAERRAMLRAFMPTLVRWLEDSVEACDGKPEPASARWLDEVSLELIEPVCAAVRRTRASVPAPDLPGQAHVCDHLVT